MNRREAQLILGVREGVTAEEIKQRHRKLMIMNHPDSRNQIKQINGASYPGVNLVRVACILGSLF